MIKPKTHLEIAEQYVDWAAKKNMTARNVWRTLQCWPALKLTNSEKEYIRVLAERKCPKAGWTRPLHIGGVAHWPKRANKLNQLKNNKQ